MWFQNVDCGFHFAGCGRRLRNNIFQYDDLESFWDRQNDPKGRGQEPSFRDDFGDEVQSFLCNRSSDEESEGDFVVRPNPMERHYIHPNQGRTGGGRFGFQPAM